MRKVTLRFRDEVEQNSKQNRNPQKLIDQTVYQKLIKKYTGRLKSSYSNTKEEIAIRDQKLEIHTSTKTLVIEPFGSMLRVLEEDKYNNRKKFYLEL